MTMGLLSGFRMRGRYDPLANERFYGACSELDDTSRRIGEFVSWKLTDRL